MTTTTLIIGGTITFLFVMTVMVVHRDVYNGRLVFYAWAMFVAALVVLLTLIAPAMPQ